MRIDAGRLAVEIPDGFEDVTAYVFEERPFDPDEGPADRLSVSFEPMPESVSAADVIASARRAMERSAGGSAAFAEGSAQAGRLAAATLRVEVAGSPGKMFLAALRWPGGLVAKVQYESRREDAAAVLERVVASVRPIGVRAAPPPGFVRRRAGSLWLEMPEAHAPITSYSFSADGGRARLFVEGGPVAPGEEPDFERLVRHGLSESIEVEPLNEGACAADGRPLEHRSWRADRVGAEGDALASTWFRAAWLAVGEGAAARVWMIEAGSPAVGDACWEDVLATMQPVGESP